MDADLALPACDPAAVARLEGQLALLGRLSAVGMTLVEAIGAEVTARTTAPFVQPGPVLFQGDIVLAFTRAARAVRLTIALDFKLTRELDAWRRGAPLPTQAAKADPDAESEADSETPEAAERAERAERFDGRERESRDDIYALLDRPTDEVIDLIRRDLGLSPEWVAQVQAEWAQDQAAAGAELIPAIPNGPPPARPSKPPERWPRPPPS